MSRSHVRLLCISDTVVSLALLAAPWTALAEDDARVGSSYAEIGFGYGFENFDRHDASNVDDAAA